MFHSNFSMHMYLSFDVASMESDEEKIAHVGMNSFTNERKCARTQACTNNGWMNKNGY